MINSLDLTLIKSISGIRGTIGGVVGNNLTPQDVVQYVAAYATFLKGKSESDKISVVVGWDARPSRDMIAQLTIQTLIGMGVDVLNLGLSTTPTVEVNVTRFGAQGGIILTASHNPKNWNALKFLNADGEFLSASDGQQILDLSMSGNMDYAEIDDLGTEQQISDAIAYHFDTILQHDMIDVEGIRSYQFSVVLDCINSTAALLIPFLQEKLNCKIYALNDDLSGQFAHNPEPLPDHVTETMQAVKENGAAVGFVVDPDVDRLAIIDEKGQFIGEENTIILLADYLLPLSKNKTTVSNLSSSRGLRDVTEKHGGLYYASAVGEVNVVSKMRETNAFFGGEGNGGVIFPNFHAGRDGLLGIILVLQLLSKSGKKLSELCASLPSYVMVKSKINLDDGVDADKTLTLVKKAFEDHNITLLDGVKIDFDEGWVHLRKSNTEPILRVYAEAKNKLTAEMLIQEVTKHIPKRE